MRCLPDGTLEGATLSDHGYIIINMFFGAPDAPGEGAVAPGAVALMSDPTPGRMTTAGGEPIPLSRRHPAAANRPRSSSADEVKVNLWVNPVDFGLRLRRRPIPGRAGVRQAVRGPRGRWLQLRDVRRIASVSVGAMTCAKCRLRKQRADQPSRLGRAQGRNISPRCRGVTSRTLRRRYLPAGQQAWAGHAGGAVVIARAVDVVLDRIISIEFCSCSFYSA